MNDKKSDGKETKGAPSEDEVLRRMLNTPPKPRIKPKPKPKKQKK